MATKPYSSVLQDPSLSSKKLSVSPYLLFHIIHTLPGLEFIVVGIADKKQDAV